MLSYKTLLLLTIPFLLPAANLFSQATGCTDPAANNYNPSATQNDGSCTYSHTSYTPPVKVDPLSAVLTETSGLQMAGGGLWSFNDGGGVAAIYRIDTVSPAILQTVTLTGATNVDWEDIAFDGTHFYLGDFGNNASGDRTDLKIYKFPLAAVPADYGAYPSISIPSASVEVISFAYSDQVPVVASAPNNTRFDCEAMIVANGKIHLFTKNWVDLATTHYEINGTGAGHYAAVPVEALATNYLVTAADMSPDGKTMALLGYQTNGFASHFMHLLSGYSGGLFFNGNKRLINLPNAFSMGQAEGLCFAGNLWGYISNERITSPVSVSQKLRIFDVSSFVSPAVLPVTQSRLSVNAQGNLHHLRFTLNESVSEASLYRHSDGRLQLLKTFYNLREGQAWLPPQAGNNCYQLGWKEKDGHPKWGEVTCLAHTAAQPIDQLSVRRGGNLRFTYSGREGQWRFRLLSTDGKLIAALNKHLTAGTHSLQFGTRPGVALVVLQMINATGQYSFLLPVLAD